MFQPIDQVLDGRYAAQAAYPWPAPIARTCIIGCDIGQIRDPSAIAICRLEDVQTAPGDPLCGEAPTFETHYRVLGAERLPLGTSYPQVARRVTQLARRLHERDARGAIHVLLDATGVGRPVCDIVRATIIPQCHVTAVTITGSVDKGDESILWREESRVGKAWLVSRLQAILQGGRLHGPRDALMEDMIEELKKFEIRIRPDTGHDSSGVFSTGDHDDLAVALCLAVSSDHRSITYGPRVDSLPSPRL